MDRRIRGRGVEASRSRRNLSHERRGRLSPEGRDQRHRRLRLVLQASDPDGEADGCVVGFCDGADQVHDGNAVALERDEIWLNRWGIPKGSRVGFKILAGMEASMDGSPVFFGSA